MNPHTDEFRPEPIDLMGVAIAPITEAELVTSIDRSLDKGVGGWVVTANLDILRQAVGQSEIAELIGRASTIVADGMPLVWAAKMSKQPLPERVAGSNLIFSVSEAAGSGERSVFFLGGDDGVAEKAGSILAEKYPGLKIAGHYCPPFGFEKDEAEMDRIGTLLLEANPDIVYVALGFPKQERLIQSMREACPNAWWLGIGISFSFVAGEVQRAPVWIQNLGLEWVHRMVQEPRRLFKRYVLHDIPFALRMFAWAIRYRFSSKADRSTLEQPKQNG